MAVKKEVYVYLLTLNILILYYDRLTMNTFTVILQVLCNTQNDRKEEIKKGGRKERKGGR